MAELFKLKYIKYKNKYNILKKELENFEENNNIDLTETPTIINNMAGGSVPTVAVTTPCPGIVNPMPDVSVPMNQLGGCAGIVNPQPVILPPVVTSSVMPLATSNKNYSINQNVDSDVNNTDDIERLFKQIGGGKKTHSRESSESSAFNSESSSLFGSDFDELISE